MLLAWVQFGTGSVLNGADVSGQLATVHIEGGAAGVSFGDDWDNVGQRLTVSGTTTLTGVEIPVDAVIGYGYGVAPAEPADHLDVLYMYAGFAAIFTGIARAPSTRPRTTRGPDPDRGWRRITLRPRRIRWCLSASANCGLWCSPRRR